MSVAAVPPPSPRLVAAYDPDRFRADGYRVIDA
jgi:hypothetical protein